MYCVSASLGSFASARERNSTAATALPVRIRFSAFWWMRLYCLKSGLSLAKATVAGSAIAAIMNHRIAGVMSRGNVPNGRCGGKIKVRLARRETG